MFTKPMLSAVAAAALTTVCATAQAQVLVEIEGPMQSYTRDLNSNSAGTLKVMNNTIKVTGSTLFVSPTQDRDTLFAEGERNNTINANSGLGGVYNVTNWMLGDTFFGRRARGLIGATVIVTGTVDEFGEITATEVFSDVAENVVLGAVYDNFCSTPECNAKGDYIRGNGPNGPVFIANRDKRLKALPITDAGLFALDLYGKSLNTGPDGTPVVTTFGGEGYFSDLAIHDGANGPERAIVYWAFELGENRPDLLLKPDEPEVSALRIRCTEGGRMEVRGFVHAPLDPVTGAALGGDFAGTPYPQTGGEGRIRVEMDVDGDTIPETFFGDDPAIPVADLPGTYGVYRLREDMDQCGTEATVYWESGDPGTVHWASTDAPVDRLREE